MINQQSLNGIHRFVRWNEVDNGLAHGLHYLRFLQFVRLGLIGQFNGIVVRLVRFDGLDNDLGNSLHFLSIHQLGGLGRINQCNCIVVSGNEVAWVGLAVTLVGMAWGRAGQDAESHGVELLNCVAIRVGGFGRGCRGQSLTYATLSGSLLFQHSRFPGVLRMVPNLLLYN